MHLRLLLLTALALSACAGPPTPTPSPTPSPTPTPAPPAAGELRVAVTGAAPHLDIQREVSEWATLYGPGPAYARLLRFDVSGPAPALRPVCDLCASWRWANPLTFEAVLSPHARWQDAEGFASRPVTPQDVVFSLERLREPGAAHAHLLAAVETIEPVGTDTVRLRLRAPDAGLPLALASPYAVVLAPDALDRVDLRTGRVVGAGPWRFTAQLSGGAVLERWDAYALGPEPGVERITFQRAVSLEVGVELLRADAVDIAQVTEEQWVALEAEGFRSVVLQRQGRGVALGLNAARAPFSDPNVRRAALLALDPQAALEAHFGIGAWGLGMPLEEPGWATTPQDVFNDPAAANALLAGRTPGFTLLVANFGEVYVEHGRALAAQLAAAGFTVTVEVVTRGEYLSRVWAERNFDAFVGPLPPTDLPNDFALALLHTAGASNVTGAGSPALDAAIEAYAAETDAAARAGVVADIQREALEGAWLFMPAIAAERWALGPRVASLPTDLPLGAGELWAGGRLVPEP